MPITRLFHHFWYDFDVETFADRLDNAMRMKGLSADQVAEATGISRSTIFRYKNTAIPISKRMEPVVSDVLRIANAIGVDVCALAFGEDARPTVDFRVRWVAGDIQVERVGIAQPTVASTPIPAPLVESAPIEPPRADSAQVQGSGGAAQTPPGVTNPVTTSQTVLPAEKKAEPPTPADDKLARAQAALAAAQGKWSGGRKVREPRPAGKLTIATIFGLAAGEGQCIELDMSVEQAEKADEFIAHVTGHSMEPTIPNGATIRIRRTDRQLQQPPEQGGIFLIRYESEGDILFTLKRVVNDHGVFLAVADNRSSDWGVLGIRLMDIHTKRRIIGEFIEIVDD